MVFCILVSSNFLWSTWQCCERGWIAGRVCLGQEHKGEAGGKSFMGDVWSRVFLYPPQTALCFASFLISNNLLNFSFENQNLKKKKVQG